MTPEQLFAVLLDAAPSQPFVTYYDEATGERSELSARSLANWVTKTHHLLTDELGLGLGNTAMIALPAHWISVPPLLACFTAGLQLTTSADGADVAFVAPDTIGAAADGIPDVYAIAPDSAAAGFRGADPAGASDYVTAVRPHADAWAGVRFPAGPDDPAFGDFPRGEVIEAAERRAAELGLTVGGRLLSTRPWVAEKDWVDAVLAPLCVTGSVVLLRNCPDEVTQQRRCEQERVTAVLR